MGSEIRCFAELETSNAVKQGQSLDEPNAAVVDW